MVPRALMIAAASLALASCATNTIRLDRAATMSAAGREAGEATMDFADRAIAANRDALIEIVAFDPACAIPEPLIASGPVKPGEPPLCAPGGERPFPFARRTRADIAATAAIVGGIAAYLDAVDAVLAREDPDLAGSFAEAEGDLEAVRQLVGADGAPLLSAEQSGAIGAVLSLISEIAGEAARVDGLRALEARLAREETPVPYADSECRHLPGAAANGASLSRFANGICALKRANAYWAVQLYADQRTRFSVANTAFRRAAPDDAEGRRDSVRHQVELYETAMAVPRMRAAIDALADDFAEAHRAYRALLDGGEGAALTPKERARRAAIEKARVRAALRSFARLVAAF